MRQPLKHWSFFLGNGVEDMVSEVDHYLFDRGTGVSANSFRPGLQEKLCNGMFDRRMEISQLQIVKQKVDRRMKIGSE